MSKNNSSSGKKNSFVYIATFFSALGGMLFGYDTGVISSAILFIKEEFSLGSGLQEITVSSVLVGAVIGAAIGGKLADKFGRRKTIITFAIIFAIGAVGTAAAPTITMLIIGRVIVGVAIGVASFTSPMYISEVSPVNIRGKLVSLNQLAVTVGIVISYIVGYVYSSAGNWRMMLGLAVVPAAALGIGMSFMPASPRWLVSCNFIDKARLVLQRIRGTKEIDDELMGIQQGVSQEKANWKALLAPMVRPALIVGIGLAVFQQITGINTIIYYAPTIFESAGFKSASAAILATMGIGVINVLMTLVAMQLVDRWGRRPLLLVGLAGMTVSLIFLGLAFYFKTSSDFLGWIYVGCLMLYVATFAIGLGPVFWLLIAEIYPLNVRGLAMSVATMFNWGANLIVGITFLSLINMLGHTGTFWLFAVMCILNWFFVWFLVPETKGRTLEEIEEHWRAGKHPLEMKKT